MGKRNGLLEASWTVIDAGEHVAVQIDHAIKLLPFPAGGCVAYMIGAVMRGRALPVLGPVQAQERCRGLPVSFGGSGPATLSSEMRIASIQTSAERGGAEYANVDLLRALQARGLDVVLVTNIPDIATGTQIPVERLELGPKLSRRSALRILIRWPALLLRLAGALRKLAPIDGVMLHFKKEQLLCSLLPRSLVGRIVWMEWGPVPPPMRQGPARALYALAARRAEAIVAVSPGTAATVRAAGVPAEKVHVVPNLVEVSDITPDPDARRRLRDSWGVGAETLVVGCVSRFQRRKRNDVVIDAMRHLSEGVLLVMAGEGEEEEALRERAAPYGGRVRFVPNVRGHAAEFLSACDTLAFAPSPTEGEPRIIVLAQLVGLPVIATAAEGAEGLVEPGNGTIISPEHDPSALAAAIESYRSDPARRKAEGARARAGRLQSHDPDRTIAAIERLLGVSV